MKRIDKKIFASIANYQMKIIQNKKWFVAYYVQDFTKGILLKRKYYGNINKYATPEERMQECLRIKELIEQNKPLPNLRGARKIEKVQIKQNFASPIVLMYQALDQRKSRIDYLTFNHYRSKIKCFADWLNVEYEQITIGNFKREIAEEFILHLKQSGRKNNTCNAYRTIFYSLFSDIQELLKNALQFENPWQDIVNFPKMVNPYRIYETNIEKYISETLPIYDEQLWLYILFVHYGFMRGPELINLKIDNIDFTGRKITSAAANTKNKKTKVIAIPVPLYKEMMRLRLHEYPKDYFVFSKSGRPGENQVSKNFFRNKWSNYREMHNIDKDYKIYAWKHTGMLKANESGVDVKEIQKQANHHSLDQVDQYLANFSIKNRSHLMNDFPEIGEVPNIRKQEKQKDIDLQEIKEMLEIITKRIS